MPFHVDILIFVEVPLALQKSRMPQILGVEGEAVVLYREPSTTQEMRYPRLSCRVNKMAVFPVFRSSPVVDSSKAWKIKEYSVFVVFKPILPFYLCNQGVHFDPIAIVSGHQ